MKNETDTKLYDVRLVQKHIYDGLITLKEYKKHLNSLEDSAQNSEEIELEDFVENENFGQDDLKDDTNKTLDSDSDSDSDSSSDTDTDPEITL